MESWSEVSVDNRIQQLDIAEGLKELLMKAGITAETICRYSYQEVSEMLHIDPYVSRIILEEAHKVIDGTHHKGRNTAKIAKVQEFQESPSFLITF